MQERFALLFIQNEESCFSLLKISLSRPPRWTTPIIDFRNGVAAGFYFAKLHNELIMNSAICVVAWMVDIQKYILT